MTNEELLERIAELTKQVNSLNSELNELREALLTSMLNENISCVKTNGATARISKNPPIYEVVDIDSMKERALDYMEFTSAGLRRFSREKPYEMLKCIEEGLVRVRKNVPYKLTVSVE